MDEALMVYDADGRGEDNSCLERRAVATPGLHTAEPCQPKPNGKDPPSKHVGAATLRQLSNCMNKNACVGWGKGVR